MTRRVLGLAAAVAAAVAAGGVAVASAGDATPAAEAAAATAAVQRGRLSATVSLAGGLTYRARPDGTPYAVLNQASGVFTRLPEAGARIGCGGELYRVDDEPVLLLCGTLPAYRDLGRGDAGADVRQLNRNLRALGYDAQPGDDDFTARTGAALRRLQRDRGLEPSGRLTLDQVVVEPEPLRVAAVTGGLGAPARPGAPVLEATSGLLQVRVDLDPSDRAGVAPGAAARITLPGNASVTGRVEGLGGVTTTQEGGATLPAWIRLDDPGRAAGLDRAPVRVEITTGGLPDALSVPVTALTGKAGGGLAVEVLRGDGRRELVGVRAGLFDTAAGRVQVEGALRAGDRVVVPSP